MGEAPSCRSRRSPGPRCRRRKGAGCRSAGPGRSCFSKAAVCCKRAADPQRAAEGEPAMSQQVQGLDKGKLTCPGNLAQTILRRRVWPDSPDNHVQRAGLKSGMMRAKAARRRGRKDSIPLP